MSVLCGLGMFRLLEKNKNNTSKIPDNEISYVIETAFLEDKMNYGRVRTSLSRYFREKYGQKKEKENEFQEFDSI